MLGYTDIQPPSMTPTPIASHPSSDVGLEVCWVFECNSAVCMSPHLWHSLVAKHRKSWYHDGESMENRKDFDIQKLIQEGALCSAVDRRRQNRTIFGKDSRNDPVVVAREGFWYTLQWGHTKVWQCHPKQRLNKKHHKPTHDLEQFDFLSGSNNNNNKKKKKKKPSIRLQPNRAT